MFYVAKFAEAIYVLHAFQKAAAKVLGVTQPRVSDLVRGRLELFSIDTLVEMLTRFDVAVTVKTTRRRRVA